MLSESTPNSEERERLMLMLERASAEAFIRGAHGPQELARAQADVVLTAGYRRQEDWHQLGIDQRWPTPRNMHRTADALDQLCVAKYGDVLRYVAGLCESVPVTEEGGEPEHDHDPGGCTCGCPVPGCPPCGGFTESAVANPKETP